MTQCCTVYNTPHAWQNAHLLPCTAVRRLSYACLQLRALAAALIICGLTGPSTLPGASTSRRMRPSPVRLWNLCKSCAALVCQKGRQEMRLQERWSNMTGLDLIWATLLQSSRCDLDSSI